MAKTVKNSPSVSPAEFAQIPLDFLISTPLITTIEAHKVAAESTLSFIQACKAHQETFTSRIVDETGASKEVKFEVPLLTMVKIPSLALESMNLKFNYNISQVVKEESSRQSNVKTSIGTTGLLSKFVSAKLTGGIEHSTKRENTANRGGTMEVQVSIKEGETPAGLQKVINALVEGITEGAPVAKQEA